MTKIRNDMRILDTVHFLENLFFILLLRINNQCGQNISIETTSLLHPFINLIWRSNFERCPDRIDTSAILISPLAFDEYTSPFIMFHLHTRRIAIWQICIFKHYPNSIRAPFSNSMHDPNGYCLEAKRQTNLIRGISPIVTKLSTSPFSLLRYNSRSHFPP